MFINFSAYIPRAYESNKDEEDIVHRGTSMAYCTLAHSARDEGGWSSKHHQLQFAGLERAHNQI